MAERRDRIDATLATLSGMVRKLEGVEEIARMSPGGTSGADEIARRVVGDFVSAFGGDGAAPDHVPGPIVTSHRAAVG